MAHGRSGRPATLADPQSRSVLTLRLDGTTKNLAIELATGYDMTIAEYIETLILRDAGQTR